MIVKKRKPIKFINRCSCFVDFEELEKAIIWFSDKPTAQTKSIYLYGRYPAVSIYDHKIHIHRLLMMYWLNRDLNKSESVHHIDGNPLNAFCQNLKVSYQGEHARHHLKGREQDPEFVKRRNIASIKARWPNSIHDNPELIEEPE